MEIRFLKIDGERVVNIFKDILGFNLLLPTEFLLVSDSLMWQIKDNSK